MGERLAAATDADERKAPGQLGVVGRLKAAVARLDVGAVQRRAARGQCLPELDQLLAEVVAGLLPRGGLGEAVAEVELIHAGEDELVEPLD